MDPELEAKLKPIFDHLDKNKNGSLDFEELKWGLKNAGIQIDDDQIRKMISSADSNQNQTIEFDEFYKIASQSSKPDLNTISEYWLQFSNKPIVKTTGEAPAWKLLVAGGVAGAVSRTCTSPLERLKILNQVEGMKDTKTLQKGVIRSLINMYKSEGLVGYFKGNGTNVIRIAPYSAIQFFSYERYKLFMFNTWYWGEGKNNPASQYSPIHLTPLQNMIAGGLAGITALLCTYPLDLIRSRLTVQVTEKKYSGIYGTFQLIVKEEGYKGLYKGMYTSILGVAPYVAINFTTYENLKRVFIKGNRPPSVPESLAFGALAGAVAQTVTYPIDLLRRRMQTQGTGGTPLLYHKGPLDAFKTVIKNEGVKGLYRGMIPCYLKVIPAISISFSVYELMRVLLGIESKKVSIHT